MKSLKEALITKKNIDRVLFSPIVVNFKNGDILELANGNWYMAILDEEFADYDSRYTFQDGIGLIKAGYIHLN